MNYIDLGIFSVLGISVLLGMYYGFTVSLYNLISFIVSWALSLLLHPTLSKTLTKRFPDLVDKIVYYSEGSSKIAYADKVLPVSSLSNEQITEFVQKTGLPNPFTKNLEFNLTNQCLEGLDSLGEYIDYTVANTIVNLMSFIIIFLVLQLLSTIVISLIRNITDLPVLRRYDSLSAGALGFFRGGLFLFIAFAFLPLLYLIIPAHFLERFLGSSKLLDFFLDANFFTAFVKGFI
ncbi:MAG: CvpA family protein [Caldicoprobacterales bacterium]|jgi:uncharacterized membrane protein required for colicin V production